MEECDAFDLETVKKTWECSYREIPKFADIHPKLPISGEKNILITSALPYVNNIPHLGNIIGCVLSGDVYARYCRLRNWNALYIAGTDEYGTATETKALEEKLTPREICEKYFKIHKETYEWFNITFDFFGRTTSQQQIKTVQEFFLKLHANGYTSFDTMEQLLCEKCDRFLADRFVEGICPVCSFEDARGDQCDGCGKLINAPELINPRCKLCSNRPIVKNSQQIFLDLPKIEPRLRRWIEKNCNNWTLNAKTITNSWLKDGLKARCITRDLKWGVPVPLKGFENKVFYVWFDAPLGYVSMTAEYTQDWRKWWEKDDAVPVKYVQFMAKDNVPFHSVMFPSAMMAVNENAKLVDEIMATEYLNYEGGKFSKSRGVGVFGTDAKETGLPADLFRFYLLYVRPEGQDTTFSWDDFKTKINSELLNNLGNFVHRALSFDAKFFQGFIPEMRLERHDYEILASVSRDLFSYHAYLEKGKLRDGIKFIMSISKTGNQYMQSNKPWVSIKSSDQNEKNRAGTVIGVSCNIACLLAIMIRPYMPGISTEMAKQLNVTEDVFLLANGVKMLLEPGHKVGEAKPLFVKIEDAEAEAWKAKFSGGQSSRGLDSNISASSGNKKVVKKAKVVVVVDKEGGLALSRLTRLLEVLEESFRRTARCENDSNRADESIVKELSILKPILESSALNDDMKSAVKRLLNVTELILSENSKAE